MKDKGVELTDGELAKLIEPGALSATLSDNQKNGYDISCHGGNDGNITNTVNGGTPSYTYLWSDAYANQNLGSVVAGTYGVTVTDANGCTATGSIKMTEPTDEPKTRKVILSTILL